MSSNEQREHCTRCGELLDAPNTVWLELNMRTGVYDAEGAVAHHESQGCFPFGSACARAVRASGGVNQRIRGAA